MVRELDPKADSVHLLKTMCKTLFTEIIGAKRGKPEWNRSRSKRGQFIRWAVLRGCDRDHRRSSNWQVREQEGKVNLAYTQARLKSFGEGFHGTVQKRSSARGVMVP